MRVRFSSALLWLVVLVQLIVPASYYLWRGDRDEERFAWRMFSAVRLQRCSVAAWEGSDEAPEHLAAIDLARALHASWQRVLERGRKSVIEAFLARRCRGERAEDPSSALPALAILERSCTSPAGSRMHPERYVYRCDSARFEVDR